MKDLNLNITTQLRRKAENDDTSTNHDGWQQNNLKEILNCVEM